MVMTPLLLVGMCIVAVAIVVVVVLVAAGAMKYDRILGEKNLSELSVSLTKLKAYALEHPLQGLSNESVPIDPGYCIDTDQGMRLVYTISKNSDAYQHHISLSGGPSYLAHSAAMTIASWMGHCLTVDATKISVPLNLGNQDGFVRHIVFELNETEQENFASKPVRQYTVQEITKTTWQELMTDRDKIQKNSLPASSSES